MKKNLLLIGIILSSFATVGWAQEKINLAGVYEANTKEDVGTKQIYAVLDFNDCEVPDFTQTFTQKTAKFSLLPDDFMKKVTKNFQGSKAAGFVKYRFKFLINLNEQLRLTNPRMENGVITVDWEDELRRKGTCTVTVNRDKTIVFNGLGAFEDTNRPDGLVITCVEDRSLKEIPKEEPKPKEEVQLPTPSFEQAVEIKKHGVNVRKGPNANAAVLMKAPCAMEFEYLGTEGQWYKVKLRDGNIGYVTKTLCALHEQCVSFAGLGPHDDLVCFIGRKDIVKNGKFESETRTTYDMSMKGTKVEADFRSTYVDTNGSMRCLGESSYTGTIDGNMIILDFDINSEEKLETPIYIYYSCPESAAYIDGVKYMDSSSMEYDL